MDVPPSATDLICKIGVGDHLFRLELFEDPKMGGWTYSVFDIDNDRFLIPESPVSDAEAGRRCAEAVIRENIAFSQVHFDWTTKT
ncbi:MAG TPA: hypothetical protein VFU86_00075 [Terriglobales bacterium]|nr:hypothetical protein [Terriglobales bacterium]